MIRAWNFLGSRNFSIFVFVMSLVFVFMLFFFGMYLPVMGVNELAFFLPFKVFYPLFFLNLTLCIIRWFPVVLARCRKMDPPDSIEEMERFSQKTEVKADSYNIRKIKKYFNNRGYTVEHSSGGTVLFYAMRGRFSPVGTILFHISFFFLVFGILVSMLFRFDASSLYPEGFSFPGTRESYQIISEAPLAYFPRVSFNINKVEADFWDGRLHFTRMGAQISHNGRTDFIELSRDTTIDGATVTANAYGFAPIYALKDRSGNIISSQPVLLRVFYPGARQVFQIPELPHKIYATYYPDEDKMEDGKITNYPPKPIFKLEIFRGRLLVYEGLIRIGEWIEFDGLGLAFTDLSRWVGIRVVNDPGFRFIWTGFFLMIVGLIWRLLLYRCEIVLYKDKEDRIWLAGRFDYYRGLNQVWLENLATRFGAEKQ